MRVPSLLIVSGLVLSAGCSEPQSSREEANATADAAPATAAPASAPDFRQLAECSAKLDAVSRFYRAVASQSSGDEAAEMSATADQRSRGAFELRMRAEDRERTASASSQPGAGSAGSQVPTIIEETEAALEAERARQPFEDFAVWLGREADRCAPLVPAGT